MRRLRNILLVGFLLDAAAHADTLDAILARMDRAAKEFKSVSAKMKRLEFTAVLNESGEMNGEMRLKRDKGGTVGLVEFHDPDPRVISFNGRQARVYYPKANTVEVYDAGKYKETMDRFLLLGFGTSGAELKKEYEIKQGGAEMVGSVQTTHLELIPKSPDLKQYVTQIEFWIPDGQSNPIREKVTQPSKNYSIVTYSDLKLNPGLPASAFELKLPPGVKILHPQK